MEDANDKDGNMTEQQEADELVDLHVRVPRDLQQQLPKAKIIARKSIQLLVREAIESHLKKLNL